MAKEIQILIDERGICQGVYVDPCLKDAKVKLLDLSVEDSGERKNAFDKYDDAVDRAVKGELTFIWR